MQSVPTTGRNPRFQAAQLGYASVADFAQSLPENAVVFDVGAGVSRLGHEVTAARNDIHWTNLDPYYAANKSVDGLVHFLSDDIVSPRSTSSHTHGTADLVYSYWMLPHLSLEDDDTARKALMHMNKMLNKNGRLVIGPAKQTGIGLLSPFRYKGTLSFSKQEITEETIDHIIARTKLWWLPRLIQRFSNRHNIHILRHFVTSK